VKRHARATVVLVAIVAAGCAATPKRAALPGAPPPPAPAPPAAAQLPPGPVPRPSNSELLALPDAVPKAEPRAHLGNPPFYEVFGQRYALLESSRGYLERGVASWYGPDFHGVRTSTGESYDMYSMTAAHKTLPLPAYARVTNLRNGRSVVVRINDRGPFKANRIIDLSYAAALKLDMVRDGTTLVEVRALEPDGPPPPAPPPGELYAQAGAFAVAENAERLRERLAAAGIGSVFLRSDAAGGRALYRVRIGPIESVAAYDALVARLHALGVASVALAPN
jgi:rare lipoprotein A